MTKFIEAYKEGSMIFLKLDKIQRIGLTKSKDIRESERIAKVVFVDGSKGEYIIHRDIIKLLRGVVCGAPCEVSNAAE